MKNIIEIALEALKNKEKTDMENEYANLRSRAAKCFPNWVVHFETTEKSNILNVRGTKYTLRLTGSGDFRLSLDMDADYYKGVHESPVVVNDLISLARAVKSLDKFKTTGKF